MGGRTLVTQFRKDGIAWVWGKWERVGKKRLERFGRSGWEELRGMGRVWVEYCRTSCGIAFVAFFAPILSAAEVVLSVILTALGSEGACVDVKPSCSDRGPVDFGIESCFEDWMDG